MATPTLSSSEETRFLDGIKRAVALVQGGLSPNAAVEKVAREERYPPGYVRLTCHALNTGRQTAQREANTSVLDKFASFELADPEVILRAMYPEQAETPKEAADRTSVSTVYARPPQLPTPMRPGMTKVASDLRRLVPEGPPPYAPDPAEDLPRRMGERHRLKQAAEEARRQHSAAHDELRYAVARVVDYLKQASVSRLPFELVDYAAVTYYGPRGRMLMDHVAHHFPREKRGADLAYAAGRVDLKTEPFVSIRTALDAAARIPRLGREKEAADKALKAKEDEIWPPVEKKAFGFVGGAIAGSATKSLLDRALSDVPKSKEDQIKDRWLELEDPDHENELRKIRTRAMINSMMTDPEDPISGHDPERVLSAYNEIAQLMPRAAEQPAVMRPLLRRQLAGHVEPFEASQMLDIEKGLRESKSQTPNTRLLQDTPGSLLG